VRLQNHCHRAKARNIAYSQREREREGGGILLLLLLLRARLLKLRKHLSHWGLLCKGGRFSYPSCKAYAPYFIFCHLWPVWLYHICPHYLIKVRIFRENVIEHKMCFDLSTGSVNFLDKFSENSQIWNFLKIRLVLPCGRMYRRDEDNSGFSQFDESAS
jgi:hypothetical protein